MLLLFVLFDLVYSYELKRHTVSNKMYSRDMARPRRVLSISATRSICTDGVKLLLSLVTL